MDDQSAVAGEGLLYCNRNTMVCSYGHYYWGNHCSNLVHPRSHKLEANTLRRKRLMLAIVRVAYSP